MIVFLCLLILDTLLYLADSRSNPEYYKSASRYEIWHVLIALHVPLMD